MNFDATYPVPSELFYKRYEISKVIKEKADRKIMTVLSRAYPKSKWKTETLVNTYFEQLLDLQPEFSYIVRFRQRLATNRNHKLLAPEKWVLKGPGTLEVKIKNLIQPDKVIKTGTFLPDSPEINIYKLMRCAKSKDFKKKVESFIAKANNIQKQIGNSKYLKLIDAHDFASRANKLSPFATRICLRHTMEIQIPEAVRITIENHPIFYAYPIDHRAYEIGAYKKEYVGYLSEFAERAKVEIKATNKQTAEHIYELISTVVTENVISNNKYSKIPYYKMIADVSKQSGVLINEVEGQELESKATLLKNVHIKETLENLRNSLLQHHNKNYAIFNTEPYVGERGHAETSRTIFGWKDRKSGMYHEIATLIRLNQDSMDEFGFRAILKLKSDSISKSEILNRKFSYEYLNKIPTDQSILNRLNRGSSNTVEAVGTCKKTKYRIYVQSKTGRTFCVSLDNTFVSKAHQLQQLEVEYVYTITTNNKLPSISVDLECKKCMDLIRRLLRQTGVPTVNTTCRKIDFLARYSKS